MSYGYARKVREYLRQNGGWVAAGQVADEACPDAPCREHALQTLWQQVKGGFIEHRGPAYARQYRYVKEPAPRCSAAHAANLARAARRRAERAAQRHERSEAEARRKAHMDATRAKRQAEALAAKRRKEADIAAAKARKAEDAMASRARLDQKKKATAEAKEAARKAEIEELSAIANKHRLQILADRTVASVQRPTVRRHETSDDFVARGGLIERLPPAATSGKRLW